MYDVQYASRSFVLSEVVHEYGPSVHILSNPVSLTLLARVCSPKTRQPVLNDVIGELYRQLVVEVINNEFDLASAEVETRMADVLRKDGQDPAKAVIEANLLDATIKAVTVDIARAGILPSQVCYRTLNQVLDPDVVRQDHLIVSRAVDASDRVVGARISGEKIGGPVDGRMMLFPDPMGATGSSLSTAIQYYKDTFGGKPRKLITLNLIVTPQFLKRILSDHPEVTVYALRLDRGMSHADVLAERLGARWDEETGLNEHGYIIPGGGGFGELMNNSWI
ncbi:MAG: uracil phosphoribosyltransferase [Deltaproteobacteria bacterium]|nr:uracil phosphoribosyltransferase [Deltaproteobacteria bacterium]